MIEKEPRIDAGLVVSESQARFLAFLGFRVRSGKIVSLTEEQLSVIQDRVNGLDVGEIAGKLDAPLSRVSSQITKISAVGWSISSGHDGFGSAVSLSVGMGLVNPPETLRDRGVRFDKLSAEILSYMIRGFNISQISRALDIDERNIEGRLNTVYRNMNIKVPKRKKSIPAVAIAVSALKDYFEKSEEQV